MNSILPKVRGKIEYELGQFIDRFISQNRHSALPGAVGRKLRDFVLEGGKRLRPLFFLCGFHGYSRPIPGVYRSAIALELLHDFILIHDDIIDGSSVRRSGPSLHVALDRARPAGANRPSGGKGMGIVVGDILYAMAISCFLAIRQKAEIKQEALKVLMDAACRTGAGQLKELWSGFNSLKATSIDDVYRIYDLDSLLFVRCSAHRRSHSGQGPKGRHGAAGPMRTLFGPGLPNSR